MSKKTAEHYRKTNSCPQCGSKTASETFGIITTYYCTNWKRCDWTFDWKTKEDPAMVNFLPDTEDDDYD